MKNLSKIQVELTNSIKGMPFKESILPEKNFIYFYNSFFHQKCGLIKYVANDFSWFITSWKYKEFAKFDYRKNSTTKGFYIKAALPFKFKDINVLKYSDEQIFKILKYYPMPSLEHEKYSIICNFANAPSMANFLIKDDDQCQLFL